MEKKGFTLIELLIVITIIALLAVGSVYAYITYKKGTMLDFAADNIVAQFYQMRSETVYGEGNADRFNTIKSELAGDDPDPGDFVDQNSQCYGLKYDLAAGEFHSFVVEFDDVKSWDSNGESWKYAGCGDPTGVDADILDYEHEQINVLSALFDGSDVLSDFHFTFYPPEGEVKYWDGFGFSSIGGDGLLVFEIQYGDKAEERFQRTITMDLINQTASVE